MKLTSVIARLQGELVAHGDVEVKLDIDGSNVDPDINYFDADGVLFLW